MKSLKNQPYCGNGRKAVSLRESKDEKSDNDTEKGMTNGEVRELEEMFDTTADAVDAFFILPDGEFLTFVNLDDVEYAEHEQIGRFFCGEPSMESRDVAVAKGCVRVVGEGQYPMMEVGREPTTEQYEGIERFIEQVADDMVQSDDNFTASEFSLELWKGLANRRNPFYERYSKSQMGRVVNDIKRYYAGENMYRSSVMAFHESSDEDRMLVGTGWTIKRATDRIRGIVEKRIEEIASDWNEDIDVVDVKLHGSRVRGDSRDDSDIDVVVEYSGDVREDDLFNELNKNPLMFEGVRIDVNPICADNGETMVDYMKRSDEYDHRKLSGRDGTSEEAAKMDEEYMALAKAGKRNACMKLVLKAASKAMPNTVLKDDRGFPKVMFHGTSQNFHYFDGGFSGMTWITDSIEYADCYTDPERHCYDGDCNDGIVLRLFANVKKVADIGDINEDWSEEGLRRIAEAIGSTYEELRKETRGYDYSYLYEINEVVGVIARRNGYDALFAMEGDGEGQTGTGFKGKAFTVGVLRPELLKLADAITYDDDGNIVPLSKRFDFGTRDIREGEDDVGMSSEDVEYARLVREGKTADAEKMVADRAAKVFDQTKVVDADGRPKVVYHGTSSYGFRSFRGDHGFWVTESDEYAEEFHDAGGFGKPGSYRLYADIRNPVFLGNLNERLTRRVVDEWSVEIGIDRNELSDVLDAMGFAYNDVNITKYEVTSSEGFVKWLDGLGFDGIKAIEGSDGRTVTWCAFYSSQLKSAGVTYDEDGNLVPLSRRFNAGVDDINESNDGTGVPRETKNLAPNGKPSNLSDELYMVVRTDNFKRWFGDWENDPENASKVIDENGEPLVVWRGQGSEHDEIKSTSYFTENRSFARRFGNASAYFLNIRYPYVVDADFDPFDAIYTGRLADGEVEKMGFVLDYPYENDDGDTDEERAAVSVDSIVSKVFYDHSDKYDGVIVYDCEDEDMISNQYVNFESNQVKSVGNNGDFGDGDNVFEDTTADAKSRLKGDATKMLAKVGGKTALKNSAKHGVKVAQRYAARKAGAKMAMAAGAKAATRSVGKSLGKAAPFVGLGLGTKFAYDRAKQGDWLGATGELASGVASCFAGPGTAAALGIDAALLARDAYKMKKSANADKTQIEQNDRLLSNPNFVRWFGDSKVVDDNDMPLAVYHGSHNGKFDSFEVGKHNKCIYFTSSDVAAKEYSLGSKDALYKCYLRIENPYVIDAGGSKWSNMKFDERKEVMKYCNDNEAENFGHTRWITPDHVVAYVQANMPDCDGVIIKNLIDTAFSTGRPSTDYIVFDPKQIKSVDMNNGAYSTGTTNIYEDDADGGGIVVDAWHGTRHAGFSQFDKNKIRFDGNGFFFSDSEEVAKSYSGDHKNSGVYRVRLTMKHPLVVDANGEWWGDLSKATVYQEDGVSKTNFTIGKLFGFSNSYTDRLARYVRTRTKFDGIVIRNVMDWGTNSLQASKYPCTDYIVFEPEQIEIVDED